MMKKTSKTNKKRLALAAAAACVAGLTFAAGSAFAQSQMQTPSTRPSGAMSGQKDIVATAMAAGQFNTLAQALQAADLVEALKGPGPFTVFAPTDAAFAKLPPEQLQTLLRPENKEQLQQILLYHVTSGKMAAKDVMNADEAETLQGEPVRISAMGDTVMLNDRVRVTKTDIMASNGVIHVIDAVLIPTGGEAAGGEMREAPARPASPAAPEVPAGSDPDMGGM